MGIIKRVILLLFLVFFVKITFSQHSKKVDPYFMFYFKALDLELDSTLNRGNFPEFYDCYYDSFLHASICYNRYALSAKKFMEDITKIKGPESKQFSSTIITKEVVLRWKNWYFLNRKYLKWDARNKKPKLD